MYKNDNSYDNNILNNIINNDKPLQIRYKNKQKKKP